MTPLRPGRPEDLPIILALLQDAGLPNQDITAKHLGDFLVAASGQSILGAAGLERYGESALLRSLVVRPEKRFSGLGKQLASAAEEHACQTGVATLYLLTTTAADFFRHRGYEVIARSEAPLMLRETMEFSTLCPSHAICMRLHLNQQSERE